MKFTPLFFTIICFTLGMYLSQGQTIRSNGQIDATIISQSAFLDASANTFSNSIRTGKGLAFPRTDLTTFQFVSDGNIFSFPTRYDGMIVYNTATGVTTSTFSGVGSQTVAPGFYYFSNPSGLSVNGNGEWIAFTHLATNEIMLTGSLSTTMAGLVSETLTLNLSADTTALDVFDFSSFEEVKTGTTSPAGQTFVPAAAVGDLYVDSSTLQLWVYDGAWKLIESAVENLYTDDGTLAVNRVVTLSGSSTLSFEGTVSNTLIYNTHVELKRGLQDANGNFGTAGQVLSSTGSDTTQWISAAQGLIRLETGDYTAQIEDGTILVSPTGDVTITLPTPTAAQNGTSLTVKRANAYTISNTLAIASAALFDESTNKLNLNVSYQGYTLKAFGGAWYITQRF